MTRVVNLTAESKLAHSLLVVKTAFQLLKLLSKLQTRDSPVGRQQCSIELGDLRVVGKLGSAARVDERENKLEIEV